MSDVLLSDDWQQSLASFNTLFVGFSGGLDSTVLMHCMSRQPMLVGKLRAVHIHHGLSENASFWQSHCQQFCDSLTIPLTVLKVNVDNRGNIEEGAREARYTAFSSLLAENDCLLLAHHCDDQAETLLLQLLRGSGIDGLAAMASINRLGEGQLARPLLQHSRQRLEDYAHQHQLIWVEDESNQNSNFSRNYLRNEIMPLLQAKWPAAVGNLVRSAKHCQHAKANLEALAKLDCIQLDDGQNTLDIAPFQRLDHPRIANILRIWLQNNKIRLPSAIVLHRLIHEVMFASADATPLLQWGDTIVRRYQHTLYLLKNERLARFSSMEWLNFPLPLALDKAGEGEHYLHAIPFSKGLHVPMGCRVHIRFRQGGELLYWRGQTKQLKKLWQQWQVPPWRRHSIPLVFIDDVLAAVPGFAISEQFFSKDSVNTYKLELQSSANYKIMV